MATNRDLLKEAIADAKAVKEMAIANAKSALEEAFTPQIREMFSAKLNEMDLEEEELEERYGMSEDEKMKMEETDLEETSMYEDAELEESDLVDEAGNVEEDMNLEELLAELEGLEEEYEMEESLNEAEEEDMDMEEPESEEKGELLDLEDLTDEKLEKMIGDVIADMIEAGELEAGAEYEGEKESEEGEEMEMSDEKEEEEVDLAELLREIEEGEEEPMEEGEEPLNEGDMFSIIDSLIMMAKAGVIDSVKNIADIVKMLGQQDPGIMANWLKGVLAAAPFVGFGALFRKYYKEASDEQKKNIDAGREKLDPETKKKLDQLIQDKETTSESSELAEAYSTIESLRKDLNEVNLLNAKLLYSNKIFKSKNLNESQKVKVLSSFDKASTVGEVKMVFETLNEGLKVKNTIKENRGIASKATTLPNTKRPIVESNDAFARMQQLAFYKSQH